MLCLLKTNVKVIVNHSNVYLKHGLDFFVFQHITCIYMQGFFSIEGEKIVSIS